MELGDRKRKILQAVVRDYICYAEPVGSRTVARRYNIGLSPATIRNEMSDLEEMGYLKQPHTSAGRVPSTKGYRFYVDYLLEKSELTEEEESYISNALQLAKLTEIEQIIQHTCKVLSQITSYTSLVLGPQLGKSAFQQMRILPMENQKGLVILITDTGFIRNRIIDLPRSLSFMEVNQVVQYLNSRLKGLTIDQMTRALINELKSDLFHRIELLEQAILLLEESLSEEESRVFFGGTMNILNQPEFKDVEKIKGLLNLFEQDEAMISLLEEDSSLASAEPNQVNVKIGQENKLQQIHDCSLITTAYRMSGKTIGTIGVLGPTRMQYARVITQVMYIADKLNDYLNN